MSTASPVIPVADPVGFLSGRWSVVRDVHDHTTDQDGRFVGEAIFSAADGGLDWVEDGTLQLGAFAGTASRTMRVEPVGGGWEVRFDDGRFFHPLDLETGRCVVDHPCSADHYAGEIRVEADDLVVIAWRVVGPAKDQTIVTRYTR